MRIDQRGYLVLSRQERLAIYIRDGFKCILCGKSLKNCHSSEIKVFKWVKSGLNIPTNLLTCCRPHCYSTECHPGQYRDRVIASGNRVAVEYHLSKSLDLGMAQKILEGKCKIWPNPFFGRFMEKERNENRGLRKEGSTTTGNQNIGRPTRLAIYLRDDFICAYCGKSLVKCDPAQITLNCWIPYPKGRKVISNLITCCKLCSLKKRDNTWIRKMREEGRLERIKSQLDKPIDFYRDAAKRVLSGKNDKLYNPWKK